MFILNCTNDFFVKFWWVHIFPLKKHVIVVSTKKKETFLLKCLIFSEYMYGKTTTQTTTKFIKET